MGHFLYRWFADWAQLFLSLPWNVSMHWHRSLMCWKRKLDYCWNTLCWWCWKVIYLYVTLSEYLFCPWKRTHFLVKLLFPGTITSTKQLELIQNSNFWRTISLLCDDGTEKIEINATQGDLSSKIIKIYFFFFDFAVCWLRTTFAFSFGTEN